MDNNDDFAAYTPTTIDMLAKQTIELKSEALFGVAHDGAELISEQHFLAALAALDQAVAQFRLASLHQTRALAGG